MDHYCDLYPDISNRLRSCTVMTFKPSDLYSILSGADDKLGAGLE